MLKEELPNHYSLPNENKWAAYFWSILEKAVDYHLPQWTAFTDPRQQQIARDLLRSFPGEVKCFFYGGYPEAERVRICAVPKGVVNQDNRTRIGCVLVKGDFPPGVLSYRDFLGALMGIGIKRDALGDIVYRGEDKAYIFLLPELAPFLEQNLTGIGRFAAEVKMADPEKLDLELAARQVREIKGTVASMRVDAVAGLGFGLSRSRIAPLIKGEQVKVNYQVINQPSKNVKVGDLISLAGKGRIVVADVLGESRKGRIHLLLHRII